MAALLFTSRAPKRSSCMVRSMPAQRAWLWRNIARAPVELVHVRVCSTFNVTMCTGLVPQVLATVIRSARILSFSSATMNPRILALCPPLLVSFITDSFHLHIGTG